MPGVPPVVDSAWVRARGDVVLADVRWYLDGRSGRAAYDAGHLPGAVFVDLERRLAAPGSDAGGRHPLPSPESFAEGMSSLGIADDSVVVAYDDAGGVIAARLVWMLRAVGAGAALLDGGLEAWDGPLSAEPVSRPRARFTSRPWPAARLASIEDAATGDAVLLDARPRERYLGLSDDPVDPRPGHIPGARSLPARENVGDSSRLLPAEALRKRLAGGGVASEADAGRRVSAPGSGVTACHRLLVMEDAGLGGGRVFPGSYWQGGRDPAGPGATGTFPDPTAEKLRD